jgi:hypothetical protein
MNLHGRLIGYNRRDQFSIGRGSGVRIDHSEKIIAFVIKITRPGKHEVLVRIVFLPLRLHG